MNNDLTVEIVKDDALRFLDELSGVIGKARASALRKGANIIKAQTQTSLSATGIAYDKQNPKYTDRLVDGIRVTSIKDDDTIGVHIMGSRSSGSGTFRLRFFEKGTKDRYAKTYKGAPLKKKKRLGKIKSYRFFSSAITTSKSAATQAMTEQLTKYIDKAWNNYN